MEDKLSNIQKRMESIKSSLDLDSLITRKEELQQISLEKDFWKNPNKAKGIMQEVSEIENLTTKISKIETDIVSLLDYQKVSEKKDFEDIENEYEKIDRKLSELEFNQFLSGKYDKSGAVISIHSGQGGTEANDWTEMLLRMYTMYAEKKGWKVEEIHKIKGEEAGINSVSIEIQGEYAFGYLKNEAGTHRLVRLSPFNAQSLRQTSFTGVEVLPIIEEGEQSEIEIRKEDIEFKATKSGGPGGQSVNKSATAVTITHTPTRITIHSSSQRSQLQNRESAMKLLRSKLWAIEEEKREKERQNIQGEHKVAAWGNQIRNYVLHPYKLVKDLRTGIESNNPESVLDGKIDKFIEAGVKI